MRKIYDPLNSIHYSEPVEEYLYEKCLKRSISKWTAKKLLGRLDDTVSWKAPKPNRLRICVESWFES